MEEPQIDIVDVEASPLSEYSVPQSPLSQSSLSELMQQKINRGKTNEAENHTIFRIPHRISQSRQNLFEPSVVSIGPFHRGKQSLKAMEEHKWRLLEAFLSCGYTSLDFVISEMKFLEETTRRCYNETFDDLDSHAFVEMMLLDGCFLLAYFLNWNSILEVGWNWDFISSDLVLQENQIPFFIVEKLYELTSYNPDTTDFVKDIARTLLPENYILPAPPAETPNTIDSVIADPPAETPNTINSVIADPPAETPNTINSVIADPPAETPNTIDSVIADPPAETPSTIDSVIADPLAEILDPPVEIHHLVHLCYHYLVPNPEKAVVLSSKPFYLTRMFSANRIMKGLLHQFHSRVLRGRSPHSNSRSLPVALPKSTSNLSSFKIPSATELKQKGLKFRLKSNPKHMLDISFEYGILKIPRLEIMDSTKPIFANLIVFEHSKYGNKHKPFTRFVTFLDDLVNTPNDVTILQECGIVENWLGGEEDLAHFLNQFTDGNIIETDNYLTELYTEVNRYIESSWHRHRAKLIRDYFSNPWAAISLIAAFILLVLTCLQSFYAVYAYKFPPSS